MSNRSGIGTAVIGGTTATGDGATIIATRGGTATVDMDTMDLCRGSTSGAAGITIVTITTVIIELTDGGVSRRLRRRKRLTRLYLVACIAALFTFSTSATAHVMPWSDGDSRIKGFGQCAEGPCMQRYDFGSSEPHHQHGKRSVFWAEPAHTEMLPVGFAVKMPWLPSASKTLRSAGN
jgi:hypothetical protein